MNLEIPNLRHLRAFRRVVETRSITEAARDVHLSQPAVTQIVTALQTRLGIRLIEHSGEGMRATPAGLALYRRIANALDQLREAAQGVRGAAAQHGQRGFANFDELVTVAQLNALTALAVTGNFSIAARQSGLSQPSIHRAARDLERLIGLELFGKAPRGIEITGAAMELATAVRLVFAEIRQGLVDASTATGEEAGYIAVGCLPLARNYLLPEAIERLSIERPAIRLNIVEGTYLDLLRGLRDGRLDILIGALRDPPPTADIDQRPLMIDPLTIIARIDHPLARKRAISKAELCAYPWIVPREGAPTRSYFNTMFSASEIAAMPGIIETSSLMMVRGMLSRSDRLTLVSAHQATLECASGAVAPLPHVLEGSERVIGVTLRKGWRPGPAHEAFLRHLQDVASAIQATPALAGTSGV